MHKAYVRELKPYSLDELSNRLEILPSEMKSLVEQLMMRGIIRYRAGASGGEYSGDDEEAARDELYQFHFVGLVMVRDAVIVSYPKYFRDHEPSDNDLELIMRVLKRDGGFAISSRLYDDGERADDRLPVMLALLELYGEYGEYSNYVEGRETNGSGAIDWNRTIGEHLPILSDGRPVYTEFETRKTLRDESDYITRLHRAVLTECSRELHNAGIDGLLSLDEVWLSDEDVDSFGDAEALEWRLNRERASQFADWKLLTLDLLERYLLGRDSEVRDEEIKTLGTTSFYHLWELACGVAFGNALGARLSNLGFDLKDKWIARKRDTLLGIIPRPQWERASDEGYVGCGDVDTLIPDTVSFTVDDRGRKVFCIYDAKYYVPSRSGKMEHQPGLESVTKQFLYQSAYKSFIETHEFDSVVNAFLVPNESQALVKLARVSFPEVMGKANPPLGDFVDMWALPANRVFEAYLNDERIDGGEFKAIWNSTKDKE